MLHLIVLKKIIRLTFSFLKDWRLALGCIKNLNTLSYVVCGKTIKTQLICPSPESKLLLYTLEPIRSSLINLWL